MKKRLKKYNTGGTAYQPVGLPVDPAYIRDKKNLDNQSGFTKFMDTFGQVAMPIAASLIPGVGGAIAGGMGSMMQKKQLNTYENANGVSNSEYDTYARTGGKLKRYQNGGPVEGETPKEWPKGSKPQSVKLYGRDWINFDSNKAVKNADGTLTVVFPSDGQKYNVKRNKDGSYDFVNPDEILLSAYQGNTPGNYNAQDSTYRREFLRDRLAKKTEEEMSAPRKKDSELKFLGRELNPAYVREKELYTGLGAGPNIPYYPANPDSAKTDVIKDYGSGVKLVRQVNKATNDTIHLVTRPYKHKLHNSNESFRPIMPWKDYDREIVDDAYNTGGTVPLNSSSFQVQGNPNVTDGNHIPALNARLDHNEVVNTNPNGAFVYSTDLKDPVTGKPFSELAKKHNASIGKAEKILAVKPYDEQAKSTITQSTKLLEGLAAQQEALAARMGHRNPDGSTKQPGQYQTGGNIIQLSKDTYFDQATNTYGRVVSQDDITKSKGYKLTPNGMAFIPYDGPELDYARKTYDPQGTGNPLLPKNVRTDMNKTPTRSIDMNARDPLLQTVGNDTTPGLSAFPDWYVAPGERDPFYPLAPDYWSNMAFGNGLRQPQAVTNTTTPAPSTATASGKGSSTKAATKTEPIPGRGPAATAEKRPPIWSPEYDAWQAKQDAANIPSLDKYSSEFAKPSAPNLSAADREKALTGSNVTLTPDKFNPNATNVFGERLPLDEKGSNMSGETWNTPIQRTDPDADITNMTGLSENGITNYEVPGTGNYKTPFTIGDSLKFVELAGKFAGLQGGPEVQKARLDNTDVTKQYYDPRVAIAQSKAQFANYANTLSAPSLNLRRSMLGAAHAQTVGTQSNILSEYEKMNQGALANYQDRLANRNRFNAQMLSRNDDANAANRGAYDSATQNLFTSVGQFGEDLNRKRYGTDYVNMMATRYPDVFKDVIKTWMGNGN